MKNYIDSEQHWMDGVNADQDERERYEKAQEQPPQEREEQKLPIAIVVCSDDELDFICEDENCKHCEADLESTDVAELKCGKCEATENLQHNKKHGWLCPEHLPF